MKTAWDYTTLADAYLKRPDYAPAAIDALVRLARAEDGTACDVGAGVAHLTRMLLERGVSVVAVEPNDAMRANGIQVTSGMRNVRWFEGTGEATGQATGAFDLVTFGSSFNVCDRPSALRESARLLKPGGWFACMWNHRWLDDPIQREIEAIIKAEVASYSYGTRREDQTEVIEGSRLFKGVVRVSARVAHRQSVKDCVEAWRSHATLERQAGPAFARVVDRIAAYLAGLGTDAIDVPYETNLWCAAKR